MGGGSHPKHTTNRHKSKSIPEASIQWSQEIFRRSRLENQNITSNLFYLALSVLYSQLPLSFFLEVLLVILFCNCTRYQSSCHNHHAARIYFQIRGFGEVEQASFRYITTATIRTQGTFPRLSDEGT